VPACFDGVYPIALPDPELLGKYLLELVARWRRAAVTAPPEEVTGGRPGRRPE
jgi:hypothetical protein